ncbi:hypothetical protein DFJ77DRAFT_450622 [Powellomyces hirtus]|nr:hypothetical protein DFJ77DRAFT_450622 [Powellomyces hirtus]
MSQSFGALFRCSSFASLVPPLLTSSQAAPAAAAVATTTTQALSAPRAARQKGNWGLKQSLPSHIIDEHPRYVSVSHHDHPWTKSVKYESASGQVEMINRWVELVPPESEVPPARAEALASFVNDTDVGRTTDDAFTRPRELETMSAEEWRKTVKMARERSGEFSKLEGASRTQWEDFLNVGPEPAQASTHGPPGVPVHPPTYTVVPETEGQLTQTIVKGRVLNRLMNQSGRFSIGVAGIVAYAPTLTADKGYTEANRNQLQDFVVQHAEFDDKARPSLILNPYKPRRTIGMVNPLRPPNSSSPSATVDRFANRSFSKELQAEAGEDVPAPSSSEKSRSSENILVILASMAQKK